MNEIQEEAIPYLQDRGLKLVGTLDDSEWIVEQFYAEWMGWA